MRTALITGASRGIGESIAKKFAENNINLVLASKTLIDKGEGSLTNVKQKILSEHPNIDIKIVQFDVRDEKGIKNIIENNNIDILVNNSGALHWGNIHSTPPKKYDLVNSVNVRGSFLLSHYTILSMLERNKPGHIIFHSPPLPKTNDEYSLLAGKTGYMISKWGMSLTSTGISLEYKERGISSNTIWPKTAIKTNATIKTGLGNDINWRKPEIVADAIYEIVMEDPYTFTGNELIDEEYLKTKGVKDFNKYNVVENSSPISLLELFNRAI